tara:strand:- start:1189 stop:1515 length:327 start_codon:yes stop_codon:yes gene_type:complete
MNKEQEIAEKLQNHRVEKSEKEEQKEGVTKFTNEELGNITKIKETYDQVTLRMGQVVFEEKAVVLEKAELEKIFDKNREDEVKFAQELNKKYGKGSLDIQTGIFTPVE